MTRFPVFIEVGRAAPLVVGGGDLAVAKVRALLTRAPRVTLAAARMPDALALAAESGAVELLARAPSEDDIKRPAAGRLGDRRRNEDARISALRARSACRSTCPTSRSCARSRSAPSSIAATSRSPSRPTARRRSWPRICAAGSSASCIRASAASPRSRASIAAGGQAHSVRGRAPRVLAGGADRRARRGDPNAATRPKAAG